MHGQSHAGTATSGVVAPPMLDWTRLTPYAGRLPVPALSRQAGTAADPEEAKRRLPLYHLEMRAGLHRVHPQLPPTRIWGYADRNLPATFPGPTIEAGKDTPLLVKWSNSLPTRHMFAIDHTLCGAEPHNPDVRAVTHLHGAKVPQKYDGYPEWWYTPGKAATYRYGNVQDASTLWYHDHAMGVNRLNIYAGMLGMYLLRDAEEGALELPSGKYEVPLVLTDRSLDAGAQLYYATSGDPQSPWVSEFFGDAVLVNGAYLPRFEAEPRPYRFRILNGSNGRFMFLKLAEGRVFHQIGTDQGLMASPVATEQIVLAPAERADVVLDLAADAGKQFTLMVGGIAVMRIDVADGHRVPLALPAKLRTLDFLPESAAIRTRTMTLREKLNFEELPTQMLLNDKTWHDPVTERMRPGDVEIWELVNTTEDSHPIHLHVVRFQILDRRNIEPFSWLNGRKFTWVNDAMPPEPFERGWKDVVRAEPDAVTRILVRFDGWPGRYAWHCHLLEHEANEMMRPFEIYT